MLNEDSITQKTTEEMYHASKKLMDVVAATRKLHYRASDVLINLSYEEISTTKMKAITVSCSRVATVYEKLHEEMLRHVDVIGGN